MYAVFRGTFEKEMKRFFFVHLYELFPLQFIAIAPLPIVSNHFFAEKKCEDKKKDECKNIDANKCRTKGNACLKSCRMCVEGRDKQ